MNRSRSNRLDFPPLDLESLRESEIFDRIRDAGIVGMGGAGYPTYLKIAKSRKHTPCVVIANGVECDPGVTADEALMQSHAEEIFDGMRVVAKFLQTNQLHIVVSSQQIVDTLLSSSPRGIHIHRVKPTASNGEERTLIHRVLDSKIPRTEYPADSGILILNVATFFAIYEAVCLGRRPIDRVMTVNGTNDWINVGDPIEQVIGRSARVRAGGPFTGRIVDAKTETSLTMNALVTELPSETLACIRCGACTDACPIDLPVEAMYSVTDLHHQLAEFDRSFKSCFECGACAEACPSSIPILDHIRDGCAELRHLEHQTRKSNVANSRFETRQQRIDQANRRTENERVNRVKAQRIW